MPSLRSLALAPSRALFHPAFLPAVALLAINDHLLKGSGLLPGALTGKISDFAGLFAAPLVLAVLLRARTTMATAGCHVAIGIVFAAIKTSPWASTAFTSALATLSIRWRNVCDPTDLVALTALLASWLVLVPACRVPPGECTTGHHRFLWARGLVILAAVPAMLASGDGGDMGGANRQGRAPGSGDDGVNLGGGKSVGSVGEIAVDPGGAYFLSRRGDALVVGDLATRSLRELRAIPAPSRVAFWPPSLGKGFFVVSTSKSSEQILSYDLHADRVVWTASASRTDHGLAVDAEGKRVVLWDGTFVEVRDAGTGAVRGSLSVPRGVADVDVRRTIVVTENHVIQAGGPSTTLHVRAVDDLAGTCDIVVPNCSSQLVIGPDGRRAFLAPTTCGKDPVSVIDIDGCAFERNLPGFGPVALSLQGNTAVAFIDRDARDPGGPVLPPAVLASAKRYHLMFIDVATLDYATMPIGDELPRYAVTPDGRVLLVDTWWLSADQVRVLDIDTRTLRTVEGLAVNLVNYAMLPDSTAAFALDGGMLYIIELGRKWSIHAGARPDELATAPRANVVRAIDVGFVSALNITPDGKALLLKDGDSAIRLLDVTSEKLSAPFR